METTRLVQLSDASQQRRVALVQEPLLRFLQNTTSIYTLALDAIQNKQPLTDLIQSRLSDETIDYQPVYDGQSTWKLLPAFDHPEGPFGCIVSGTGLTHKNSALNRQMMHESAVEKPTDSMQIYQWGVEGGSPEPGTIGVQPEWFYKGNGAFLRAHGQPLEVPEYGNDGGEEPEVAGAYLVDEAGTPWRIGFCTGNEFSDHIMEKKNYLYLAPSKLRQCAIGPELVVTDDFSEWTGTVSVDRNGTSLWSSPIRTGEKNMAHSLQNLEYHHFKYEAHRLPLQAHVHFFGADAFSFGQGIALQDGDLMRVEWSGLGRALQNPLRLTNATEQLLTVQAL
ncbi:AraD1 family protein [Spirosoma endbachense]|uniref:GguC protein n=1 Tax=Spirosoma endbachense TaxID=2666025 RepID=A0A6P1W7N6_9BACT|nr:AraD1 family protein [Spirosoma endbachense]QHW00058.1 GguC protein [Spirosoma endbachense]